MTPLLATNVRIACESLTCSNNDVCCGYDKIDASAFCASHCNSCFNSTSGAPSHCCVA